MQCKQRSHQLFIVFQFPCDFHQGAEKIYIVNHHFTCKKCLLKVSFSISNFNFWHFPHRLSLRFIIIISIYGFLIELLFLVCFACYHNYQCLLLYCASTIGYLYNFKDGTNTFYLLNVRNIIVLALKILVNHNYNLQRTGIIV